MAAVVDSRKLRSGFLLPPEREILAGGRAERVQNSGGLGGGLKRYQCPSCRDTIHWVHACGVWLPGRGSTCLECLSLGLNLSMALEPGRAVHS